MNGTKTWITGALLGALLFTPASPARQEGGGDAADMAAMMQRMQRFTQPGEQHEALERFLGSWDTQTRLFMGGQPTPPEKGTAEASWLMPGRWVQSRTSGTMMRMPIESFLLLGYDNVKRSYVASTVTSMDTAMNAAEGDMDPGGKALILYGTLDEYLSEPMEHDKMVKYLWRFPAEDELVLEVHDLAIGLEHTKVIEVRYTRRKS
jgi:hypothetical protein